MEVAWFHFVLIAVLFSSLARAQNTGTAVSKPGPENGTISNSIYTNELLGFSYPIPDGWQINRDDVGAGREGEAKRTPGGGLELLVIDQHTARPFRNRIVMSAIDTTGMSATTREYTSKFVQVQVNREGRELVRDAIDVELAGKHFFRADYKQPISGGALSEAFVCTKFRGYFLGWTFVAGSPEELEGFVNSLQRLTFHDDPVPTRETNGMVGSVAGDHPGGLIGGVIGSVAQPSPSVRPMRVRVSQGVSQALLVKKVQPQYPDDARQARIQGLVVLKALIDTNGDVKELTLVSGHPLLAPAALEAVKQWKYKSYKLNGTPVDVETQVTVAFTLTGD
jgi:TonB family protein